jgi:hypothetical protein
MRYIHRGRQFSALAIAAVAVSALTVLSASTNARGAVLVTSPGLSTNYDFARLVLDDGGWPASPNNVTVLTQWLRAEEPTYDWWDRDNPLNNGLGSGGGSGLGSYSSVITAAFDVARNLENQSFGYPQVARDLAGSAAPEVTAQAIWRSDWAAGHYGFGADWETTPVPAVAAPPSVWRDPSACPAHYAARVVGPCGTGFSSTGGTWHSGSPGGLARAELWAFAGSRTSNDKATWRSRLAPGTYEVAAFVPGGFADATAEYRVTSAAGSELVRVDQEPYLNAWVPLGTFPSTSATPISVSLAAWTASPAGAFVAVDAMRFLPVVPASARVDPAVALRHVVHVRRPAPPQDVAAVAGDASASISWLGPSKDGGRSIRDYLVIALPGGHACQVTGKVATTPTCTIHGLRNGTGYTFVARADTAAGWSRPSLASLQVRPVQAATARLSSVGSLRVGGRVVLRAEVSPARSQGTVLFAVNGVVLRGCATARVVRGRAECSLRLRDTGIDTVLATYSGSPSLSGAEALSALEVTKAASPLRVSANPDPAAALGVVSLRAWSLPGLARGQVVFTSGSTRLCVAGVHGGGGRCAFRLRLPVGVHVIVGTYRGDHDFLGTAARTTLRVVAPPST